MSAVIKPDHTRILESLYQEKKTDWLFIVEAIGEAKPGVAAMIKTGLATDDGPLLLEGWKRAVKDYIESELVPDAVEDFLR